MQGLRTQESEKFNKFMEVVQKTAKQKGKIFFCDCGEGRDFETGDMEGEDLCGWLIPAENVDEFEALWMKNDIPDQWVDNMAWAEWRDADGAITVEFKTY